MSSFWARPRLWLCLGALLCSAPATNVRAYEDQITLGLGGGYAHAFSSAPPQHGALLEVTGSTGLSSVWTLRGIAAYAFYPDYPADQPLHAAWLGAELLYMIDVVEFVPHFGAGLDGVGRAGSSSFRLDGATHLVLGWDYLVSRDFALGLDLRSHLLVTALSRDPVDLTLSVSASWIFER